MASPMPCRFVSSLSYQIGALTNMRSLLTIVLLSTAAEAVIVFNNSLLIDQMDLEDTITNPNGVEFPCPKPGCTVYTTKATVDSVGVYENGTLLMTLDKIYEKRDKYNYLFGIHLEHGPNYSIKSQTYSFATFKVYIVADVAGSGFVVDFGSSDTIDIDASGKQIVTVLNTKAELTFQKYFGSALPLIYAAGFDSVGTCNPVYKARSIDNAALSEICVFSGLATVDFGSTSSSNHYHVVNAASVSVFATEGQSVIATSPGYAGCPGTFGHRTMIRYNIQYWSANRNTSIADVMFDDIHTGHDGQLVLAMVDYRGRKTNIISDTPFCQQLYNTTQEVDFIWDPSGLETADYFQAQVNFQGPEADESGDMFVIAGIAGAAVVVALVAFIAIALRRSRAKKATSSEFSSKQKIRGIGGFGCVFEAVNTYDNGEYAVKRIGVKESDIETALGEVRAMALLEHPNIVRYNSTWVEQPPAGWQDNADAELLTTLGLKNPALMNFKEDCVFIYIQMQLCNYSLSDWLECNQEQSSRNLFRMMSWFHQIVSAVDYIHEKNMIHRDLKPSNILFAEADLLKLCDLGIATERKANMQCSIKSTDPTDEFETDTIATRTTVGTAVYMSPEQRIISRYSSKSDVFTLGLILAELCVVMTETTRSEIFNNLRRGIQCDLIEDEQTKCPTIREIEAEFIKMMTRSDPMDRPSCRKMLEHPFFS